MNVYVKMKFLKRSEHILYVVQFHTQSFPVLEIAAGQDFQSSSKTSLQFLEYIKLFMYKV